MFRSAARFLLAALGALVFGAPLIPQTAPTSATAAESASRPLTSATFNQELIAATRAATTNGIVGVAIRDLATGEEFSVEGDRQFSQAGLSKIHVLTALLRESAAGRIDLDASHRLSSDDKLPGGILSRLGDESVTMSLRDYATLMVALDDNSAANIILSKIGVRSVHETLTALGAEDIHFAGLTTDPKNPDDNLASPCALVRCLASLHEGRVLDSRSREEFFSLLSTPRLGALRVSVPRHIRIASKSGLRGGLRCTAAIVFLKNHPYVMAIMTQPPAREDNSLESDATATVSTLSKLAYNHFSHLTPAEPTPERSPPPSR